MSTRPAPTSGDQSEAPKPRMGVRLASLDQPGPLTAVNAIKNGISGSEGTHQDQSIENPEAEPTSATAPVPPKGPPDESLPSAARSLTQQVDADHAGASDETLLSVGTPEWVSVTRRRETLIRKEFSPGGLTGDEAAELERLEAASQNAIQQAFPSPFTDDLEALERVAEAARRGQKQ